MMGYQKVTPTNNRKETEEQQQQQPKTIEWHRAACNRNYTLCTTRFFGRPTTTTKAGRQLSLDHHSIPKTRARKRPDQQHKKKRKKEKTNAHFGYSRKK